MEQERQITGTEQDGRSGDHRGLAIIVGAGLGYLVGRGLLKRPIVGVILGVAVAIVISSSNQG